MKAILMTGNKVKHFLSCDWGTSSLRIRLADAGNGKILAETLSGDGIARTFERWQQSGLAADKKTGFYLAIIAGQLKILEKQTGESLNGLKLVLSGMASSSIGFIELPYTPMPFNMDGTEMTTALIAANEDFKHDVLIISGAKTRDDVMRGEETQLIGCAANGRFIKNELFIFPGTHSKHISVRNNRATALKTYMTGEVFSLLAQQSILKNTVQQGAFDQAAFKQGVIDAASSNLLNSIFKVRTNSLFDICSKNENYHYLSGLLIGTELRDIALTDAGVINLVCASDLLNHYWLALAEIAPDKNLQIFSAGQADEATVRGHLAIAKNLDVL